MIPFPKRVCSLLIASALSPLSASAAFSNYNSVLIGEQAAGMGGAFSALTGDPAAASFYNPATLARSKGSSLSAAVNVYHKYETDYGGQREFNEAPLRVNRGALVPIPASSGTVYSFGNTAFALSIVFPDFNIFNGDIRNSDTTSSFLNLRDESLWVGGSVAMNLSERDAAGLTMYYTARNFSRSLSHRVEEAGVTTVIREEKSFSQNSLVYQLGYWRQIARNWTLGLSYRLPSIPVSGNGSYVRSAINTAGTLDENTSQSNLVANTEIPAKGTLGLAYRQPKKITFAFDVSYYEPTSYFDFDNSSAADKITHKEVWNYHLGGEYYLQSWLALRMGLYTNLSSHPEIPSTPTRRLPDHIDMWGFSTNFAIFTSDETVITLGGYYSGGKGFTAEVIGEQPEKISKSIQVFSFLAATSFYF